MPPSEPRFTVYDTAVLIVYFAGITFYGLWVSRKTRSSGEYFLGDRQLPWWIMVGQAFGTGTHAEQPVAQAGAAFQNGFATIWYQWKNMLATPFYWLMAPWYRRSERTTIGEIIEDRYGRFLGFLYSIFAIAYFVFNQGAMLKGAGKVIAAATANLISSNQVVLWMTVAFLVYSFFGGLVAAAYTVFIQGLLIIVLSFLLIPWGLDAVGGLAGMKTILPGHFYDLYNEASQVTVFTIAMLTLNGLTGITAQPHILSMCATGRTERSGRVGQTYGSLVKRFCTVGWAFIGLIAFALVVKNGAHLKDPEEAFGYACLHLLGPGLIGLMVAGVLAANMSTCSNFMVNTGALFTKNFYVQFCRPQAADKELLWVGRISGLLLTFLGVWFAFIVKNVLSAFLFTETIAAFMGIMFMGGILWRRANRYGGLAATVVAFGAYYGLNYLNTGQLLLVYSWEPVSFGWAMLAGCVALIAVSLVTPREDQQRLNQFFDRMRRSTDGEGDSAEQAKPLAADRGQDLILLDLPGWLTGRRWHGFIRRYREDFFGFLLAWLSVAGLIALAWGIMRVCR